jgi:hypothetical protein
MKQHHMVLQKIHADGSQEWACPTCSRRFVMHWSPNYEQIVLEEGNQQVTHSCSTIGGGSAFPELDLQYADTDEAPELTHEEIRYLEPFTRWLSSRDGGL